jgi:hypothetical protein
VPDRPLIHRRTAVAGALGGIAAVVVGAGCDTGEDLPSPDGSPSSSSRPTVSPTASAEPQQTADQVIVDHVTAQLFATLSIASQAWKVPRLRRAIAPLIKAHRRHIRVLEGELPPESPPGPLPDAAAVLSALRQHEQRLKAALVDGAGRADSGALAKLLASISASVTQHLIALPAKVAP